MNPLRYEYSDIDQPPSDLLGLQNPETDYFTLFEFSAKFDPVPTMLTQNHVNVIKGFLGQTTGFKKPLIKKSVVIMAEREGTGAGPVPAREPRAGDLHVLRRARSGRLPARGGRSADRPCVAQELARVPSDPEQHSFSGGQEETAENLNVHTSLQEVE